ncbi:hypothetical protein PR048_011758 [Dryococelus australis]|uniref:Uncharacterized protein n=1 Tax=Dryococelus australis TaxID=614101 RepID=A0ABQ9HMP1_9NEOP|nr:hypothetical protein PR048_011758 [Dryococelus australis]
MDMSKPCGYSAGKQQSGGHNRAAISAAVMTGAPTTTNVDATYHYFVQVSTHGDQLIRIPLRIDDCITQFCPCRISGPTADNQMKTNHAVGYS